MIKNIQHLNIGRQRVFIMSLFALSFVIIIRYISSQVPIGYLLSDIFKTVSFTVIREELATNSIRNNSTRSSNQKNRYLLQKRLMDIFISSFGLLVLSPLFLFLAIVIKISSSGPVFYRATRVGQNEKLFVLYKFRSMIANADSLGPGITHSGDKRITRIGYLMRRTKLDELPQLFNVLKGDMSLVGPRPEDPRYVALYTQEQRKTLCLRPGITSAASVVYRNEESILHESNWENQYINEILPTKLAVDLKYAENLSISLDIQIIMKTLKVLVE